MKTPICHQMSQILQLIINYFNIMNKCMKKNYYSINAKLSNMLNIT